MSNNNVSKRGSLICSDDRLHTKHARSAEVPDDATGEIHLQRHLGLFHGVAIIIGLTVGSGIFVSPKAVLEGAQSVGLTLVLWLCAGLLGIVSALCTAELGTTYPSFGAEYHYLGQLWGAFPAVLYMWTYILLIRPAANALKCLVFATYVLQPFFADCPIPPAALKLLAVTLAWVMCAINCMNPKWSARGQSVFSSISCLSLLVIAVRGMVYIGQGNTESLANPFSGSSNQAELISYAIYSGYYAFAGWYALNYVAEELVDPYKTLPRAILCSQAIVIVLYLSVNLSYLAVLGADGVLHSEAVAVTFAQKTLGPIAWAIPVCIALTQTSSFNSAIMTGSRLVFVASRNGHLPKFLSLIQVKALSPITAVMFLTIMITVYCTTSGIYELMRLDIFGTSSFSFMTSIGILYQRWKRPDLPRPLKMPIVLLVVYMLTNLFLLLIPVVSNPAQLLKSALPIYLGGTVYYLLITTFKNHIPDYVEQKWDKWQQNLQLALHCAPEDKDTVLI